MGNGLIDTTVAGGGSGGGSSTQLFTTVTSKTTNYTVLSSDAGKVFDNASASGTVEFTLPSADASIAPIAFSVSAEQTVRIIPGSADYIKMGPYQSGTGSNGSIEASVPGSFIVLKPVSASVWQALQYSHVWDIDGIVFTKSWLFDAASDLASNNSMTTPNFFATGGTLAIWYLAVNSRSGSDVLFSYTDEGSSKGFYLLAQTFTDPNAYQILINPFFSSANGRWQNTEGAAMARGVWTHLAITYDASDVANDAKIYINGQEIDNTEGSTPVGTYNSSTEGIVIGNNAAGSGPAGAWIAQVAAWSAILTPEEIDFIHADGRQVLMGAVNRTNCYCNYVFGNHASDDITSTLTNVIGAAEDLTVASMTATEEYTLVP